MTEAITMKALELTKANDMKEISVPKPSPSETQILVKVKFSSIDTSVNYFRDKTMDANFVHDKSVDHLILGYHFSGTVEAIGKKVTTFKNGDAVFGHLQYARTTRQGAFSEYITVEANECALKLSSIDWKTAAASSTETTTALQALRDKAGLVANKTVLIIGAGGGVGGAAIGVAKSLQASKITAVCSTPDVERVKALGADEVVDRRTSDMATVLEKYDVVFDTTSRYKIREVSGWLNKKGGFVNTLPKVNFIFLGPFWGLFSGKSFRTVFCHSNKRDLELAASWIEKGSLKIEIDSTYKVSEFAEAWKRHDQRNKKGRVVIQVEDGW